MTSVDLISCLWEAAIQWTTCGFTSARTGLWLTTDDDDDDDEKDDDNDDDEDDDDDNDDDNDDDDHDNDGDDDDVAVFSHLWARSSNSASLLP